MSKMTYTKKHKPNKPRKQWIINSSNSACVYQWRNPKDRSRALSNSLDFWVEYAKLAEKGKLNALFMADHYSAFDNYSGPNNWALPFKHGVNAPRIDPAIIASAVARETESISLGITFSTLSEHPYLLARKLASLDEFTNGRVGWNIVASYLDSSARQLLNGEPFPQHDERYVRTEEYVEVVLKLLESSWREDALVNDGKTFIEPTRVRQIDHKGKYFDVSGPAITEPSPQRVPLLIQAGTSTKGKILAAEVAEIVFVFVTNPEKTKNDIALIRKIAEVAFGRDPQSIKFVVAAAPIVGRTQTEAEEKFEDFVQYIDDEASAVRFGGISGIDLNEYELDEPIDPDYKSNSSRGMTENQIRKSTSGSTKTKREILQSYRSRTKFIGTPEKVADLLEELVDDLDIDGFNFGFGSVFPSDLKDIVDLLIPELQKRGVVWSDYPVKGGSFRENFYGKKGHNHLPSDHPYSKFIWKENESKEEFEKKLKDAQRFIIEGRKIAANIVRDSL